MGLRAPRILDKEISYLCDRLGWTVELMVQTGRGGDGPDPGMPTSADHAKLLIVDEADRSGRNAKQATGQLAVARNDHIEADLPGSRRSGNNL